MRKKVLHGARILPASLLIWANLVPLSAEVGDRTIGQFVHAAWSAKDGLPSVNALAQTSDGFLWLGTMPGLYRFDGVSFEHYQPGSGPAFQSSQHYRAGGAPQWRFVDRLSRQRCEPIAGRRKHQLHQCERIPCRKRDQARRGS
jgi:hypothetical protein